LFGILVFTIGRLALFATQWERYLDLPEGERIGLMAKSFFMGWRFDTVISGYLLAVPLVLLSLLALFKIEKRGFYQMIVTLLGILYTIVFAITFINIPYFRYFADHLTTVATIWFSTPDFVVSMIMDNAAYVLMILAFFCFVFVYFRVLKHWRIAILEPTVKPNNWKQILLVSLLTMGITFLGIRGRIEQKSPIRVGTASFSNYALPNQLGLNPVFTFIRSWLDDRKPENKVLRYMDDQVAIDNVREYLNIKDTIYKSPIARKVVPDTLPNELNVVVIMLESMSAQKMGRYGHPLKLTPFLDSLATVSQTFDSVYTAGIHTFNGLYSTLYGYPALMRQHLMDVVTIPQYTGLPNTLRDKGYQTIHFMTHDPQFDNVAGFFSSNGYETIISKGDFPKEQVMSTLGVPDHYMFDFAVPRLNAMHQKGKPFFASFMTTSDHVPYIIPEGLPYEPRDLKPNLQIIEYVDWSLQQFFAKASKEAWFDRTLFVILADHGQYVHSTYDMPLSYHHTPFLVYCPALFETPKTYGKLGLQLDTYATIMGLLNLPYVNNTLGIDLFKENRPFAYFSADNKYGILNHKLFVVIRNDGEYSTYKYLNKDITNYNKTYPIIVNQMQTYSQSMTHVSQWLIMNQLTGNKGK